MTKIDPTYLTATTYVQDEPPSKMEITRPNLQGNLRELLQASNNQRRLKEEKSLLSTQSVQKSIEGARHIRLETLDKLDGMQSKSTYIYYLGWAQSILNASLIGGALVSVGILIFTGGGALPPMLVAANALSSITSGAVNATKAVFDYQRNLKEGELQEVRTRHQLAQQQIQKVMKELKVIMDEIAQEWKHLRHILDRQHQATKSMR